MRWRWLSGDWWLVCIGMNTLSLHVLLWYILRVLERWKGCHKLFLLKLRLLMWFKIGCRFFLGWYVSGGHVLLQNVSLDVLISCANVWIWIVSKIFYVGKHSFVRNFWISCLWRLNEIVVSQWWSCILMWFGNWCHIWNTKFIRFWIVLLKLLYVRICFKLLNLAWWISVL